MLFVVLTPKGGIVCSLCCLCLCKFHVKVVWFVWLATMGFHLDKFAGNPTLQLNKCRKIDLMLIENLCANTIGCEERSAG